MAARFGCVGLAIAGLAVVLIGYGLLSVSTVPPGYVGVVVQLGQVQQYTLPPGIYFRPFMVQQVVAFETRVRPHAFKEIDASSREYQSVKLTGALNFSVDPSRAAELYQRVGLDFADRVIDSAFTDIVKEVVPQYQVTEILGKRDEIRTRTKEQLAQNLSRYGINVDDIYLTNIAFSPEYTAAIEAKQVAAQQVEQQRQILEQKRVQADQAEAEAQGAARAEIARAQGAAEANRLLTESITPALIDYQRVQKWDGKMPLYQGGGGDTSVILPGPGSSSATSTSSSPDSSTTTTAPRPVPSPTPVRR
jgi:regulator of protease activity HflC (stomatin/prohibitin superfamily)